MQVARTDGVVARGRRFLGDRHPTEGRGARSRLDTVRLFHRGNVPEKLSITV